MSFAAVLLAFALVAPAPFTAPAAAAPRGPGARPLAAPRAVDAQPDLPTRALELSDAGRRLDAWRLLLDELPPLLRELDPEDDRLAAELELAALVLTDLVAHLSTWEETARELQVLRPFAPAVPPPVVFRLEHLLAHCLQRIGQPDRARDTIGRLGYVSDWYLIGPFDNERGSGFDVEYEPERRFDRTTPVEGKERAVSWRLNPGRHHPLARVSLQELLRPNQQAVAYLATALNPKDPGPVVLRVGSTGPYKVFLNGELVASRRVERPYAPDQDRHAVVLRAGWNSLLVKLGNEDGPWLFDARFTHLDGRPHREIPAEAVYTAWPGPAPTDDEAALIIYGVEPESMAGDGAAGGPDGDGGRAATAVRPAPDEETVFDGGEGSVPRPAAEAPEILAGLEDARAARLLAVYHLLVHPDDFVDRTAAIAATRAVELEPESASSHYLLARAHEPLGATRNEMEVNQRLHALQAVLELDPQHVAAMLDLAAFSMSENPIPRRADDLTARAVDVAPGAWDARGLRAEFLDSRQRSAEADWQRREAEATDEAAKRSGGQLARVRRLTQHGLPDVALATLRNAFARDVVHRKLVDELVRRLVDAGDLGGALQVTEIALRAEPFDAKRMLDTAGLLEHGDAVFRARARELVETALEVCPENLAAWKVLVRFDERSGNLEQAAASLRRILELEPGDNTSRRHLEQLTKGQEERFEEPYRWDAAQFAATPLPAGEANDPMEVLARTVVWQVNPDGTEHQYEHLAMRVLNQGGVRMLDVVPVVGQGQSTLYVYHARVIHPDGLVEHAPSTRTGDNYRPYDMPPLRVGDIVDIEYRFDQTRADVFGEYFGIRHDFYPSRIDRQAPTRRSELIVIAPPEVPLHVVERNGDDLERSTLERDDGLTVHRWVATDLARPPVESGMPDSSEFVPLVDVTTFRDWDHFADWWWHFIEKEFVTTPAMSEKVEELTEGLESEREKIEAIVRFVGQEIRYNAWAFGTHGYEPYSAATIFERRFGDCKDKSILLRQMLAEIGVEAIPVLVKAEQRRAEEPLSAAMIGLFNHCIAYVPATDEREALYLDATADRNPLEYLRADDQGARVLHVSEQGGRVQEIPFAPPAENAFDRAYEISLNDEGGARVRMIDESNGSYGVIMRHRYGGEQGDLGQVLARQLRNGFGAVTIVDLETSDMDDIGEPARMEARFRAEDLWTNQGELKALRVGYDELGLADVAQESAERRRFDVVLERPFSHETRVLYRLPADARVTQLPQDVDIHEPGVLRYSQSARETDQGVEVSRSFILEKRRIPLAEYVRFQDAMRRVQLAEARTILVQTASDDVP